VDSLKETIVLPLKYPNLFSGLRRPFSRFMFYGPPNCGKHMAVNMIAHEIHGKIYKFDFEVFNMSPSYGNGHNDERTIKLFFNAVQNDQTWQGPKLIVIDKYDSYSKSNNEASDSMRRQKTELLVQLHAMPQVIVIFLVEEPWQLCPAVRRRTEKRLYFKLPDEIIRAQLLFHQMDCKPEYIRNMLTKHAVNRTAASNQSQQHQQQKAKSELKDEDIEQSIAEKLIAETEGYVQ